MYGDVSSERPRHSHRLQVSVPTYGTVRIITLPIHSLLATKVLSDFLTTVLVIQICPQLPVLFRHLSKHLLGTQYQPLKFKQSGVNRLKVQLGIPREIKDDFADLKSGPRCRNSLNNWHKTLFYPVPLPYASSPRNSKTYRASSCMIALPMKIAIRTKPPSLMTTASATEMYSSHFIGTPSLLELLYTIFIGSYNSILELFCH